jgi:hypothetical protein
MTLMAAALQPEKAVVHVIAFSWLQMKNECIGMMLVSLNIRPTDSSPFSKLVSLNSINDALCVVALTELDMNAFCFTFRSVMHAQSVESALTTS